jgi:hypothetical protein
MRLPNEDEYVQMLGRLQDVMAFAAEELEQLANGVKPGLSNAAAENVCSRLRSLARGVMFRIGNDEDNPVPTDLPPITETPTPDVPS